MPDSPSALARRILLRPLLWALVGVAVVAFGVSALFRIPVEVLPRFDFPQVAVVAHQPGATATELETLVARPIEGQVLAIPNLVSVRSVMGDGTLEIDARFRQTTNAQEDLLAVNSAIDRARGRLPPGVEPLAQIMGNAINEVVDYSVEIPSTVAPAEVERSLRASVVPALRALDGVQLVELYGAGDAAIWVQPDLDALRHHGVPITAIVAAIRSQVLLAPGGYVTAGHQDVLIEARSLPVHIADLERIPVPSPSGPIPLASLARIVRSPVPTHNAVMLDGRPGLALTIFKQPGASTVPVTKEVAKTLAETAHELPPGAHWVVTYDQGHLVHVVGTDLGRNLALGGVLAILVLFWVLGAGRGIWLLAFSIPMSLLLGIAALYEAGQSLNLMTLGALTIAVGLLADDAIIVLESIYHRWESGDGHWLGVWNGVKDIAAPDATGTFTTVAIFIPLLFVGGLAGLFFIPFALAMALSLLASLVVSLVFIPLGLGFLRATQHTRLTLAARALNWVRAKNEHAFVWVSRHPVWSVGACVVALVASAAGLALVNVSFLPLPNEGVLLESYTLPPGTSLVDTEAAVQAMTRRIEEDPAVAHVWARIGSSSRTAYTEPAYAGEVEIPLKPNTDVNSLDQIGARIEKLSRAPGIQVGLNTPTLERVGESLSGLPQPFVIHVFGSSIPKLRELANDVANRLRQVPELTDIFNNDGYPITQLDLTPRPDALATLHLTPADLYAQLEPLLAGKIVAEVPQGNVPLALYVRVADAPYKTIAELRRLPIRVGDGGSAHPAGLHPADSAGLHPADPGWLHPAHPERSRRTSGFATADDQGWTPLGELAKLDLVTTPNQIRHLEGARALDIFALPSGAPTSAISAAKDALAGIKRPPGYRITFGGLYPELERAALGVGIAAVAAFVLMLGILILQFEGLLVPGLLLLEIPLAFTGGAAALVLSGVGLNAVGLVAFLTLIGIGLNHEIVLLTRTRRNEAAGMPVEEAVREAIHVRFRPIVLTTLTAVLGMLPTALGWGQGAAPEQGLAVVLLGGILWSAVLSTNLIPALYLNRRKKQLARGRR